MNRSSQHMRWLRTVAAGAIAFALAACGGGGGGDGGTPAPPATPPATNAPPTISGSPTTAATEGVSYSFAPTAADANGDALTFGVDANPAWAAFNTTTGQLTGTPVTADVGSYPGIVIWVSDGTAVTRLAQFTLTVTAAGAPTPPTPPTPTPPTPTPPTTPGVYPGYTYTLPIRAAVHLAQVVRRHQPHVRRLHALKGQVDDVVVVTNGVAAAPPTTSLSPRSNSGHYGYCATDSVIMFGSPHDPKYIDQAIRMVDLFVISENAQDHGGHDAGDHRRLVSRSRPLHGAAGAGIRLWFRLLSRAAHCVVRLRGTDALQCLELRTAPRWGGEPAVERLVDRAIRATTTTTVS